MQKEPVSEKSRGITLLGFGWFYRGPSLNKEQKYYYTRSIC